MMIPILMYHQIGQPSPRGTYLRGATVHPRRFANQMRLLKMLGYTGVSMKDALPYLRGEKQGKVVAITFDDGYVNVLENALPILLKHGFTATNYMVSGLQDNGWAQAKGALPSELMNADQLRQWHAAGLEVGSHTIDHVYMTKVGKEEGVRQLRESKAVLENITQDEVQSFCYPFGDQSLEVREWVREAGYSNATATFRGLAHAGDDMFALPRVSILRSTHLFNFWQKCCTPREEKKRQRKG
ncbi:MAG: polysaccharide deacetylase family protein [Paenalcaligenes sp.]